MFAVSLGQRLKLLRIEKGMSQERLANSIGISRSALSMYELDRREPDIFTILRFADYFLVTTDYLLGREERSPNRADKTRENLQELIRMVIHEVKVGYSEDNDNGDKTNPSSRLK